MAAQAGEIAQKTRVFHCATCAETVSVRAGDEIPPCRNGHTEFKRRMQEPGRRR
ncbi:MAG TPA: hypothetical protein VF755_26575 [Catenuloplanes sp.]|jgi:hypothetical protein